MLRALLLYLSDAPWATRLVLGWAVARQVARRFVAGETTDDAINAVRGLNAAGLTATLDLLGESVTDADEARAAAAAYLDLISRIQAEGLDSWVSVKLTALGLDIDPTLCRDNMRDLLACAREAGIQVAVDMESSAYTQTTLDMVRALREEDGFHNVRAVIQAYLYRSDEDIAALAAEGVGVLLCKGAYNEPPSIAYPEKAGTNAAFVRQTRTLLEAARDGHGYPAIATHDEGMISAARSIAAGLALPPERYEFQMLYGIRTDLQHTLHGQGYRMRVYVPFGTAWYPYFMRRLAERPANLWFFLSNFFRR